MVDITTTRDRLIRAATELFWTGGFSRTGVTAIIRRSGATSGSFYHFFPTKEALLLAVLERAERRIPHLFSEVAATAGPDPVERLFAAFEGLRTDVVGRPTAHCFPLALLTPELSEGQRRIRDRVAAVYEAWLGHIRTLLAEVRGGPMSQDDLEADARWLLGAVEGAAVQARAHGEIAVFDEVLRRLRLVVAARRPERSPLADIETAPPAARPRRAHDWRSW